MIDRRIVTDVGIALLIALPSALPAAPSPWNSDDKAGRADSAAVQAPDDAGDWVRAFASAPADDRRYGRS